MLGDEQILAERSTLIERSRHQPLDVPDALGTPGWKDFRPRFCHGHVVFNPHSHPMELGSHEIAFFGNIYACEKKNIICSIFCEILSRSYAQNPKITSIRWPGSRGKTTPGMSSNEVGTEGVSCTSKPSQWPMWWGQSFRPIWRKIRRFAFQAQGRKR